MSALQAVKVGDHAQHDLLHASECSCDSHLSRCCEAAQQEFHEIFKSFRHEISPRITKSLADHPPLNSAPPTERNSRASARNPSAHGIVSYSQGKYLLPLRRDGVKLCNVAAHVTSEPLRMSRKKANNRKKPAGINSVQELDVRSLTVLGTRWRPV
jgi:hypothetical protein